MKPLDLSVKNLLLTTSTDLTLADRRLYNYLLIHAFSTPAFQLDFSLPVNELIGVYGTHNPPLERLQESFNRLMRTLIEFQTTTGNWIVTSLLAQTEIDPGSATVYYTYSIYCRSLFENPMLLGRCLIQAHFIHKYSNLLYELLSTAHFANQTTLRLESTELRARLMINEQKFTNFGDLNRFVLMPALAEINAYASFAAKFTTERKGMKVTHVLFELTAKRSLPASHRSSSAVIPPRRPLFFIDDPAVERAYAYLLNAPTQLRRQLFDKAIKLAATQNVLLDEASFDLPDIWFKWVQDELLKL